MPKRDDIKSLYPEEIAEQIEALGIERYRAVQIFRRLTKGASGFSEMNDLPLGARNLLETRFEIAIPAIAAKRVASDHTIKYLWRLQDGNGVESVLMEYKHGNSLCISSQVGCRMGCAFCASTKGGFLRHLAPSEMLDQVIFSQMESGRHISNIVLMGTGEPLDNMDSVLKFIGLAGHEQGLNIGQRHISLSTCGLCNKIDALAEKKMQITLSVSLHAADNETRNRLMPINKTFPIEELMRSCRAYFEKTKRRISFEYAMIDGINDSGADARRLARLLNGFPAHVNLIRLNKIKESALSPSSVLKTGEFLRILEENRINTTVRRSIGRDIDAACGQLRRSVSEKGGLGDIHEDMGTDRHG